MRESFNPVPSGPIGLSRAYLERLQRAATRGSSIDTMSGAGTGDDSSDLGTALESSPERWLWVAITEQPDDTHDGYSGTEQWPQPGGTWIDVPDGTGITFDNGVTSSIPVNPLFELSGSQTVPIDDPEGQRSIVQVFRGYQHGGSEADSPGQEWVFKQGGGDTGGKLLRPILGPITDDIGIEWWVSWIQDMSLVNNDPCPKGSPDNGLAWLASWYQELVSGYCAGNQGFQIGGNKVYGGYPTGQEPLTLDADFGGEIGVVTITAPRYWSPHQDQGFVCDASGIPVIGPGTG